MAKKKLLRVGVALLVLGLLVAYFIAFFQPGVWHRNTFLYREENRVYSGMDEFAYYHLQIVETEAGANISFKVNDTTRHYQVEKNGMDVVICEDGVEVFHGKELPFGDTYLLENEAGEVEPPITIIADGVTPTESELFPEYLTIYNWARTAEEDVRGDFGAMIVLLVCMLFLALDLIFPNLFYYLSHGLATDGGSPSAFYRFGQMFSRFMLGLLIVYSLFATFYR